jgi:hypothetical protein
MSCLSRHRASPSTRNIDEAVEVPPGVLHTLVENAFTWPLRRWRRICPHLRGMRQASASFFTPSAASPREPLKAGSGGGLAYVRRRLKASALAPASKAARREPGTVLIPRPRTAVAT